MVLCHHTNILQLKYTHGINTYTQTHFSWVCSQSKGYTQKWWRKFSMSQVRLGVCISSFDEDEDDKGAQFYKENPICRKYRSKYLPILSNIFSVSLTLAKDSFVKWWIVPFLSWSNKNVRTEKKCTHTHEWKHSLWEQDF